MKPPVKMRKLTLVQISPWPLQRGEIFIGVLTNIAHVNGKLEYWSDGVLGLKPITPILHYSVTPFFEAYYGRYVGTRVGCRQAA
jgi:hypothetical protein